MKGYMDQSSAGGDVCLIVVIRAMALRAIAAGKGPNGIAFFSGN